MYYVSGAEREERIEEANSNKLSFEVDSLADVYLLIINYIKAVSNLRLKRRKNRDVYIGVFTSI